MPADLRELDGLCASTHGVSVLQLLRTAHILAAHPQPGVTAVFRRHYDSLVAEVADRLGDRAAADAALGMFTTEVATLKAVVERADGQPAMESPLRGRPLIKSQGGQYFYAPDAFATRFQVSYIKAAVSGSWPFPLPEGPFASNLRSRRSRIRPRHDFERRVKLEVQACRFGVFSAATIEPVHAPRRLGVVIAGEIDAVAADPERLILWIISAKDAEQALSVSQVRNQLKEFYGGDKRHLGGKSHVAVLHRHVTSLHDQAATVARTLGVAPPVPDSWQVRGLFVIRVPGPAAADRRCTYPVVLLSGLRAYLESPPDLAPETTPAAMRFLASPAGVDPSLPGRESRRPSATGVWRTAGRPSVAFDED